MSNFKFEFGCGMFTLKRESETAPWTVAQLDNSSEGSISLERLQEICYQMGVIEPRGDGAAHGNPMAIVDTSGDGGLNLDRLYILNLELEGALY